MAVLGKSSADRTTRWEVLVDNLEPELPSMPHLGEDLKALEAKLARARILLSRQEDLRSQDRAIREELTVLLAEGDQLRSRLGQSLKGRFGFTDPTLVKFGFRPRPTTLQRNETGPAPDGPATQPE